MDKKDIYLADAFDPRRNSLDFLRFFLAALVIYSHAYVLGGYAIADPVALWTGQVTLGALSVHAFFFLSGFLIVRSAVNCSSVPRFLWHRFLRIYPGFWACLLVTAFVLTPLLAWATQYPGSWFCRGTTTSAAAYVKSNWMLVIRQYTIGDLWGPNGSLWTLWPEMLCYLMTAGLALFGVLRSQRSVVTLLLVGVAGYYYLHILQPQTPFHTQVPLLDNQSNCNLLLYFLIGAGYYLHADKIAINGRMAAGCALLLVLGVAYSFYALIAPLALPYLAIWLAVRLPIRDFARYGDFSYGVYIYGFPIQVMLAKLGLATLGVWLFATAALAITVVLAALSYHLVERHALRLKSMPFDPRLWWAGITSAPTSQELSPGVVARQAA